jgi:5-methylcytosine-specific restriction endonuclease McrA
MAKSQCGALRITRKSILKKTNSRCAYCGTRLTKRNFQRDHLEPLVRFRGVRYSFSGSTGCKFPQNHNLANIVPACRACNRDKGSMDLETWRGCFPPGHVFYMETEEAP